MAARTPQVILLGGPNGAGKSTAAPGLLRDALAVTEFVNADTIARGLSAFDPESAAIAAGRSMLVRLDELERERSDFAFESTLASRSFAPRLRRLRDSGYFVRVVFLWLPKVSASLARVRRRVQAGGHDVPATTIKRRFQRGLVNFFELYAPLGDSWQLFDNTTSSGPRLIASGGRGRETVVTDADTWRKVQRALEAARRGAS